MSILIKGIPLAGYEISIMKDGERYRARVDGIWCEVEEIPTTDTDSDTISRQTAIDALKRDMASIDHIIKGMSVNDVRLDAYVSQRNQVNYDIYTINNLPPVQPVKLSTNLAEVGTDCISREQAIEICNHAIDLLKGQFGAGVLVAIKESIEELPPAQPERIKGHWIESNGLNILMKKFIEKGETWRMCDKCGAGFMIGYQYECDKAYHETFHNFCPNCGAEMREVTT